jgi:hypothetical protein
MNGGGACYGEQGLGLWSGLTNGSSEVGYLCQEFEKRRMRIEVPVPLSWFTRGRIIDSRTRRGGVEFGYHQWPVRPIPGIGEQEE